MNGPVGATVLTGFAMLRGGRRRMGYGGLAAGAIGLVAAFRNVTPAVEPIAEVDNYVLPVWLIGLGVGLTLLARKSPTKRAGTSAA